MLELKPVYNTGIPSVAFPHNNIRGILALSPIVNKWLILPAVYQALIFTPELTSEEILNSILNDGTLDDVKEAEHHWYYDELYKLIDSVVMSFTPFTYNPGTLPGDTVHEVRILDNNTILLTMLSGDS
jgi:hypothetical protein